MEIMADAVDAREVDMQPEWEASLHNYFYFVIFIGTNNIIYNLYTQIINNLFIVSIKGKLLLMFRIVIID